MHVVAGNAFEVGGVAHERGDMLTEGAQARLECAERRVVQQQRSNQRARVVDQALDDQAALGDKQIQSAQRLVIADVAITGHARVVRSADAHDLHDGVQSTRAWRMTASAFRRISLATSYGSPC